MDDAASASLRDDAASASLRDDAASASLRDDAGSASVWVVAFAMIMLVAAGSITVVGGAIVDRHRAATAADLAALAGAAAVARATAAAGGLLGADQLRTIGCAAAGRIADANVAHVVSCDVVGTTVAVTVSVALSRLARVAAPAGGTVTARARAGPG